MRCVTFLRFTARKLIFRDLIRGWDDNICYEVKENFTVFLMLFTELQTDKYFVRFGPKRAPRSAFSYCFVDVVPPKPLRERRFGAWTRVFENEKRECT